MSQLFRDSLMQPLEPRRLLAAAVLKEITPFDVGSDPSGFRSIGDIAYFTAGGRLYRSDGTADGTIPVPGTPAGLSFNVFPELDGSKILVKRGGAKDAWVIDLAMSPARQLPASYTHASGTVTPLEYGPSINGKYVFIGNSALGIELFIGNPDGSATVLSDALPSSHKSVQSIGQKVGGIVYFLDQRTDGIYRLCRTDGTVAGTRMLKEINTGASSAAPFYMTSPGADAYFLLMGQSGGQLWKANSSAAGQILPELRIYSSPWVYNGKVLFYGSALDQGPSRLMSYDPLTSTVTNLATVADGISNQLTDNGYASGVAFGGRFYVNLAGALWVTDGTAAGTKRAVSQTGGLATLAGILVPDTDRLWVGSLMYFVPLADPTTIIPSDIGLRISNSPYALPPNYQPFAKTSNGYVFPFGGNNLEPWVYETYTGSFAKISGFLWNDLNDDGVRQSNEPPATDAIAFVDRNLNGYFDDDDRAALSDENGNYLIDYLSPGSYQLGIAARDRNTLAPGVAFREITLAAGETLPDQNFGGVLGLQLKGSVYLDRNQNAARESSEVGLAGIAVYFDRNGNKLRDTGEHFVVTGEAGDYIFPDAHSFGGNLRTDLPAGYNATGTADRAPSTGQPSGRVMITPFSVTDQPLFGGISTGAVDDRNFNGVRDQNDPILGDYGGTIFLDLNENGERDTGEPAGTNFNGLLPGTYTLRIIPPSGWRPTSGDGSQQVNVVSDRVTNAPFFTLRPVEDSSAQLIGRGFHDLNYNRQLDSGEPQAPAAYFLDLDDDGVRDPGELYTPSDAFGQFRFTNVAAGEHQLRVVTRTSSLRPVVSRITIAFDGSTQVSLPPIAFLDSTLSAVVRGSVLNDLDGNGSVDAGESPLSWVIVYSDVNQDGIRGSHEPSTIASEDGRYILPVAAGTHTIRVVAPAGWTKTSPGAGDWPITAVAQGEYDNRNFSLVASESAAPGAVRFSAFRDSNANGVRDLDLPESFFAGPDFYLDLNANGLFDSAEPRGITRNSEVWFAGLTAGSYRVLAFQPASPAYVITPGGASLPLTFDVSSGALTNGGSFGLAQANVRIAGTIFDDVNQNGEQDENDRGVPRVKVRFDTDRDGVLEPSDGFAVTDAEGRYLSPLMLPGSMLVLPELAAWQLRIAPAGTMPVQVTLLPGATSTSNFAIRDRQPDIHGTIFIDKNWNKSFDSGDEPIYRRQVNLIITGSETVVVFSDNQGRYRIPFAPPGSHRLALGNNDQQVLPANPQGYLITIGNGGTSVQADFGIADKPLTASGTVFNDLDGDGVRDSGEPGIASVRVFLDANFNGLYDSGEINVRTGSTGSFTTPNIPRLTGDFRLHAENPSGFVQTLPQTYYTFNAEAVETVLSGRNFGFQKPTKNVTAGHVYKDLNGNGTRDSGEPGIPGRTIWLDMNDGVQDPSDFYARSDREGYYVIRLSLGKGESRYVRYRELLPAGWVGTQPAGGGWRTTTFTDGSSQTVKNFGSVTLDAQINGRLYNDLNGNGSQNSGEAGLSGRTVWIDTDKDGVLDTGERRVQTDSSGLFTFASLAPGSYRVRTGSIAGWRRTTSSSYYDVTLTMSQNADGKHFGFTQRALLGGNVFNDANGNKRKDSTEKGLSAWKIFLDTDNDGKLDADERTATTDSSGNWRFTDLSAATYRVRVILQATYKLTTASSQLFTLAPAQVKSDVFVGVKKA